jgi:CDGSH-type Zn-finger protein
MAEPKIADTKPCVLELKAGTYWWCTCAQSQKQPWCDGSHSGTGFSPSELIITEDKRYALCACKRSEKGAICDGTHASLKK